MKIIYDSTEQLSVHSIFKKLTRTISSDEKIITLKRKINFIALLFFFLVLPNSIFSQAIVTTDRADYPPGDTVIINGSGFFPFEGLTLQVVHADTAWLVSDSASHEPWQFMSDANGNFLASWIIPADGDEVGATLKVTADGNSSGIHAQNFFTDAIQTRIINILPASSSCGATTVPVQATLEFKSGPNFFPLTGKTVSFTLGTSTGSGVTNASGIATATLTIPASATTLSASWAGDGNYGSTNNSTGFTISSPVVINSNPAGGTICAANSFTFSVSASGNPSPTYQWKKNNVAIPGATGNSFTISNSATADAGNYSVDATNVCGTVSSSTVTLTVNSPPVINSNPTGGTICAGNSFTFSVSASGNPSPTYQWKKNNIAISGATGSSYTISNSTTADAGNYSVAVTNSCGMVSSSTVTLTVNSPVSINLNPVGGTICEGNSFTFSVSATGNPAPTYQWKKNNAAIPGAIGNSFTISNSTTTDAGNYSVDATNSCGTVSSSTVTLTVNPLPVITTSPSTQSICSGDLIATISLSSDIPGTTFSWAGSTPGNTSLSPSSGTGNTINCTATNNTGTVKTATVTITATSPSGCISESTATIDIKPIPNVVATPTSQTVCSGSAISAIVLSGGFNGTTYSWSRNNISTVTGISTSGSGNISGTPINNSTSQQTILYSITPSASGCAGTPIPASVNVNTAPFISASTISSDNNTGTCGANLFFNATVSGFPTPSTAYDIGGNPISSPYFFPVGSTTVNVTSTNSCGTSNASFDAIVSDVDIPAITCNATVNTNADLGNCSATVLLSSPTASDNCGIASVVNDHPSSTFAIGTTTVTWTATDVHGNTNTCTQNVVVSDNEIPSITCNSTVNANTDLGNCSATVLLSAPAASDNCGIASVVNDHPSSTFAIGTTTVTWTATDVHGNTNTCTQDVVVSDNEIPSITCNSTINANTDLGNCSATVLLSAPTASDNCGIASVVSDHPSSTFPIGATVVWWTATDIHGNINSCVQNVIITDHEIPAITCNSTVNANTDLGNCSATVLLSAPAASDNCGIASVVNDHPSSTFAIGTTTVTWTATDVHGNTNTCSQNVVVTDNQNPVLSGCSANIILPTCVSTATWTAPTATDNCSATVTSNYAPGATFPIGTTTVTYTAADPYANSVSCSFTVTRLPSLSENVVVANNTYWNACNGTATISASGGSSPYTYSKDNLNFQSSNILADLCEGTYTVTVKDADGCTSSASCTVTQPDYSCGNLSEYTDADIGGWGAAPNGGNISNTWLYPYFNTVYPNGVSIGSAGKIIHFTSACAISNWLPAGGTSRQLDFSGTLLTNPLNGNHITCPATGTVYGNTLASKVLALTLNVDFDRTLPNFNPQFTITYGDLIYTAAPFAGWRVRDILVEANRLIGQGAAACGQTSTYYSTMTTVISNIIQGTNTRCPNLSGGRMGIDDSVQTMVVKAYPNPFSNSATIEFTSPTDALVTINIYSSTGELVASLFNENVNAGETRQVIFNGENYAQGIYIYKITAGDKLYYDKLILSR